ncbi:DUF4097 domain-containing protein [Pendulispora brunnea]|uniref:DUF4097 domain-containing protein n=1 Tax=Pendulispora brunnea TaxID=2905690 RepID=A0ABZ2K1N9_9BACT
MHKLLFIASLACLSCGAASVHAQPAPPPPPAAPPAPPAPPAPAPSFHVSAASPKGTVTIDVVGANLNIIGWAKPEVSVKDTSSSTPRIQFSVNGDRTTVRSSSGGALEVRVPAASAVEVRSSSGDVQVRDVTGALRVDTISGAIELAGAPQSIAARTASGDVKVEANTTQTTVRTLSGEIRVRGVRGTASLDSVSGSVALSGSSFARVDIHNTSSDISFDGQLAAQASFEARSTSGDVRLVLPSSTSSSFELRSYSGSIRSQLGGVRTGDKQLDFKVGTGASTVRVQTFSGDIAIDVRK